MLEHITWWDDLGTTETVHLVAQIRPYRDGKLGRTNKAPEGQDIC